MSRSSVRFGYPAPDFMVIGEYDLDFRLMLCKAQGREYHLMALNEIMYIGQYYSWNPTAGSMSWHYPETIAMGKRMFQAYVMWRLEEALWPTGESTSL